MKKVWPIGNKNMEYDDKWIVVNNKQLLMKYYITCQPLNSVDFNVLNFGFLFVIIFCNISMDLVKWYRWSKQFLNLKEKKTFDNVFLP